MQIQTAFLSTTSLQSRLFSSMRIPASPVNEPPRTVLGPVRETSVPVDEPVPAARSEEVDSFRRALEDVFRARLHATEETKPEKREHHHNDDEQRAISRGLRDIRHAVKHELKSLTKALEGPEGADGEDEDHHGTEHLRRDIKRIGKEFDRALKDLGRHGDHVETADPAAVLSSVRTAFDDLFSRLGSRLGVPEETAGEPVQTTAFEVDVARHFGFSARVGAEASPTAPAMSEPTGSPPEGPVAVSGADEVSGEAQDPQPADPFAQIRELLSSLVDHFESLFAEFESTLAVTAPEESDETEETEEDDHEHGELTAVPADSAPSGVRFELAISTYSSIRIEFSQVLAGSTVDALS